MMKKVFLAWLLILLAVSPVCAAQGDFLSSLDYKGDSGFSAGVMFLRTGALGDGIVNAGFPALPTTMVTYGGNTFMGFQNGLRWGGFGQGGEVKAVSGEALSMLSLKTGGANFDYGHAFSPMFDATAGLALGVGTYELTLRKQLSTGLNNVNQIHLTNGYLIVGPRLTCQYKLNEWFAVQAVAGYLYGIGNSKWKDAGTRTDLIPGLRISNASLTINFNLIY